MYYAVWNWAGEVIQAIVGFALSLEITDVPRFGNRWHFYIAQNIVMMMFCFQYNQTICFFYFVC